MVIPQCVIHITIVPARPSPDPHTCSHFIHNYRTVMTIMMMLIREAAMKGAATPLPPSPPP